MKKKLFVVTILMMLLSVFLIACGKKDVFGFLDVKLGDSKDAVKEKYGDDFALNEGNIYAYTNIKKEFECNEQYVSFTFDSEKVNSINVTWTLKSDADAKEVFNSVKEIAIKQYGDEFETDGGDNPEYIRWSLESHLLNIIRTDDELNGYKVSVSILPN